MGWRMEERSRANWGLWALGALGALGVLALARAGASPARGGG
ncbi:lytic transglycosylase, partial [Thermus scotoductus]